MSKRSILWINGLFTGIIMITIMLAAPQAQAVAYPAIFGDNSSDWIMNVTFGAINNTSAQDINGYADYTRGTAGLGTDVVAGKTYSLSVTIQAKGNEYITHFLIGTRTGILLMRESQ